MAIPTLDTPLVAWGENFGTKITATPTAFALTAPQAAAFDAAYDAFVTALNTLRAAREAGNRSVMQTEAKDIAKDALLVVGRSLYGIVQKAPSVTDIQRTDLGVANRDTQPTPIPAPQRGAGGDGRVRVRTRHPAEHPRRQPYAQGTPTGRCGRGFVLVRGGGASIRDRRLDRRGERDEEFNTRPVLRNARARNAGLVHGFLVLATRAVGPCLYPGRFHDRQRRCDAAGCVSPEMLNDE